MYYYCGIILDNSEDYLIDNCINLNYFYEIYKNTCKKDITNSFYKLKELDKILEGEFYGMYDSIFEMFINSKYIEKYDYNKIIYLNLLFYLIFRKNNKINENIKFNNNIKMGDYSEYEGKLLIRTGINELRVANMFQYGDKELITNSIKNICKNYNDEEFIYNKFIPNWISIDHEQEIYESYIKELMTNAGFYFNENDYNDGVKNMEFFSNGYKNAIIDCDYLMHWNFLNCYSLDILNEKKKIKELNFFMYDQNKTYDLLSNKKILFLTPFKDKIDKVYNSGNIYKLKKYKNLENIDLITVETFLTTYPNKKHSNFIETFEYYCNLIDEEFTKKYFNIFICSAGCYGILLCNYVHKKYKITSLYVGHEINNIFGIATNRNINFLENSEYYELSDLNSKYKNLEKIENNTYGIK